MEFHQTHRGLERGEIIGRGHGAEAKLDAKGAMLVCSATKPGLIDERLSALLHQCSGVLSPTRTHQSSVDSLQ